jgi:putative flippase GtrA
MKFIESEFRRFILVGGLNTILSFGLFLLLMNLINYKLAYTLAFVLGILGSYLMNTYLVFHAKFEFKKLLKFPFVYIFQYLLGLVLISIFVDRYGLNKILSSVFTILASIPISFVMSRWIIKPSSEASS